VRRTWICREEDLSIVHQCKLLAVPRASFYYQPCRETPYNLELMRLIDEQYMRTSFYGAPRMTVWLQGLGHAVNHKRVERLMRVMGLQATLPGPHTSRPHPEHKVYPYLLRGVEVAHVNHVWSTDITYIPMRNGFMYLIAIMDWFSRYVLEWEISNTMDVGFCVRALKRALNSGIRPEIFNTDQGAQFTSELFTRVLADAAIQISMNGRGRALDNVFVERLWWSVKYENVYLRDYADGRELYRGLDAYFRFYNHERLHTSLQRRTPGQVYGSQ
jgi:putative transposase